MIKHNKGYCDNKVGAKEKGKKEKTTKLYKQYHDNKVEARKKQKKKKTAKLYK